MANQAMIVPSAATADRYPKRFRARAYPVNVEPGSNVVKGPYVAETIAVSVESDYVVVDL